MIFPPQYKISNILDKPLEVCYSYVSMLLNISVADTFFRVSLATSAYCLVHLAHTVTKLFSMDPMERDLLLRTSKVKLCTEDQAQLVYLR